MELQKYIDELDRIQMEGAFVFIKWDGEREKNRKTVLIEKPDSNFLFRRDTDDLVTTLKEGIAEYDAAFSKSI
ncbi:hypothetical protein [Thalassomonas actiniarum]|uniref:Uncharacterized protein n=1 Tax=Thalassomonas actiniarum TaxID=485447 RepID=A0AAF0C608_9GAMM|nr:hypothetical protein [Thalassomonas actiniarum]WDE01485.1 hypothetical protein SG35_013230 [Thalassomonas actiniarum]